MSEGCQGICGKVSFDIILRRRKWKIGWYVGCKDGWIDRVLGWAVGRLVSRKVPRVIAQSVSP